MGRVVVGIGAEVVERDVDRGLGDRKGASHVGGGVVVAVAALLGRDGAAARTRDVHGASGDGAVAGGLEADWQPGGGSGANAEVGIPEGLVARADEGDRLIGLVDN